MEQLLKETTKNCCDISKCTKEKKTGKFYFTKDKKFISARTAEDNKYLSACFIALNWK